MDPTTSISQRRSRWAAAISRSTSAAAAVVLLAACTACGGSSSGGGGNSTNAATGTTATTAGPQSALGTLLPQAIQDAGVLRIAGIGTAAALDRQLARATAAALGTSISPVSTSDAVAAVATGRADLGWASLPDVAAKRRGITYVDYLQTTGGGLFGIAVKKGDGQLVAAVQAALQHLRDDGTYGRVLAKNHATTLAVSTFGTNEG